MAADSRRILFYLRSSAFVCVQLIFILKLVNASSLRIPVRLRIEQLH